MARSRTASPKEADDLPFRLTSSEKRPAAETARRVSLSELCEGQEAEFFALLSEKQELTTRDGKPYYRVTFRDAARQVNFPIWSDSPHAESCRSDWAAGQFYKLRAVLRQSNYGPQLDIKKIGSLKRATAATASTRRCARPRHGSTRSRCSPS
jgi:hypothetical protein